jgi:hypothetical protein
MFLCLVETGDFIHLNPDSSLKQPPVKPNTSNIFETVRYDSVEGVTGGSTVYIIYEFRAYPYYLISYKN